MAIIVANEKEFVNFLNDGFATGIFKLKLKKLQDKSKRIMIIYKRSGQNITLTNRCCHYCDTPSLSYRADD